MCFCYWNNEQIDFKTNIYQLSGVIKSHTHSQLLCLLSKSHFTHAKPHSINTLHHTNKTKSIKYSIPRYIFIANLIKNTKKNKKRKWSNKKNSVRIYLLYNKNLNKQKEGTRRKQTNNTWKRENELNIKQKNLYQCIWNLIE